MKNRNQFEANDFNDYERTGYEKTGYGRNGGSTSKTLVAIAAGAAAGAVTAMLLTPKTGAETRRAISESANKVTDTIKQGLDALSSKVEETIANGSELLKGAEHLKNEAGDALKQGVKNTAQAASNYGSKVQENLSDYGKTTSKTTGSKGSSY